MTERNGQLASVFRVYVRSPANRVGLVMALLVIIMAFIPRTWLRNDPSVVDLTLSERPGFWVGDWGYPLGTDFLGRDLLCRIVAGARLTLVVSGGAALLAAVFGTLVGMLAGYWKGWLDEVVCWVIDVQLAFPVIALAIAMIAVLGGSTINLIFVLATTSWPTTARVARAQTLAVCEATYFEAAVSIGSPVSRLIRWHVLPNILSPLLAVVSFEMARLVLSESALSFLGLGVAAPSITWGGMIGDARSYIYSSWWTSLIPGVAICALVVALNFVGDGIGDALDPRARYRVR